MNLLHSNTKNKLKISTNIDKLHTTSLPTAIYSDLFINNQMGECVEQNASEFYRYDQIIFTSSQSRGVNVYLKNALQFQRPYVEMVGSWL
jgi:hypothetical protein